MQQLNRRGPVPATIESVILVDDGEPGLPGSDALVAGLKHAGFNVSRVPAERARQAYGLVGLPLLLASRGNNRAYMGGYGSDLQAGATILERLRSGNMVSALPVLGCAVGASLRRAADPLALKYPLAVHPVPEP